MKGILVDTSVWVDFFNGTESREERLLTGRLEVDEPVYLCPTILQEILQGFRSDADYEAARESLLSFPLVSPDPVRMAVKAADLYRSLRKQGLTIRKSNDCLIAAAAIEGDLPICFKDRDFGIISLHTELRIADLP